MHRHIVLVLAAAALAAPAAGSAQSTTDRERERIERERERAQEARDRAREREQERRDREQERRDQERERRERESAGSLDTTVAFDARGTLTVTCPGGEVIVTGGDRNELRVHARTENGGIRFTSNGTRATLEPMSGRGCSDGRFEVAVPVGTRVSANSWSGSVTVRGVRGELEAHTQSGDIDVRDAGARLDVESLSGNVTIAGVAGESSIHTVSGDVQLSGARGNVEIETVSGDLQLRDVAAHEIRTHTTSGDLTFDGQILDAGRYEFNTHSGGVRLALPANVGAQLSVSTFSGGIDSEFPMTLRPGEHGIGAAQAKRLDFSLGQGTARIVAETFSGDITLTSAARRP
jgi:DUF4097 and DUF4098 domain-containing protein YvlB